MSMVFNRIIAEGYIKISNQESFFENHVVIIMKGGGGLFKVNIPRIFFLI